MSNFDDVRKFHEVFDLPVRDQPTVDIPEEGLRIELIREEFEEYKQAVADKDIVEIADALADLLYVVYGAGLAYGIPLDEVFEEVQASNMTKLGADGKPIKRQEDGKILKGPNYKPPNIAYIVCVDCGVEGEPCIEHVQL